jgi:hypothetical protein
MARLPSLSNEQPQGPARIVMSATVLSTYITEPHQHSNKIAASVTRITHLPADCSQAHASSAEALHDLSSILNLIDADGGLACRGTQRHNASQHVLPAQHHVACISDAPSVA